MPRQKSRKNMKKHWHPKGRPVDPEALAKVQQLIGSTPWRKDLLIEYLHAIQDDQDYLSLDDMNALAQCLKLAPIEVYEVATFYHHFDVIHDQETPPPPLTVRVCNSISCELAGSKQLIKQLAESTDPSRVRIQEVPCVGRCAEAPIAVVGNNPVDYAHVQSVNRAIELDQTDCPPLLHSLDDYLADGGYQVVQQCLNGEIAVEELIQALQSSGLRGLGGAGFPAARKWEILRTQSKPRWVAVNIDEGEPGTFKDRHYLEEQPHQLLEGVLMAAWAIESEHCVLYVRDEYPAVRESLANAIDALKAWAPFDLPMIEIRRGAGAYICGEESAMIESIEGKRGMPRQRPPYIAEQGLFGQPTLEHNCETLFWVPEVLSCGTDCFNLNGRHGRKGLRSFSLSGRVNNPGVHFAPAGITLQELVDEYGGGMQQGHNLYGYLPGGASGGILPASLADQPLDFDTLQEHGCFIGSAAVIVFSDQNRARDVALNAMRFFKHESCGQCTPCREGTSQAVELMQAKHWDTAQLEELACVMEDASICGLGQAAPNPLRCVIKYFPDEISTSEAD